MFQPVTDCQDKFFNPINNLAICNVNLIASSITKTIRDSGFSDDFTTYSATGVTKLYMPVIAVSWLWVVALVVIRLFCLTLLLGSIWKTHKTGVRLWRLNPLALIFLGLNDQELREVEEFGLTADGLKKKAERMRVKLDFSDRRALLVS
jgi:hypothetical protein